MITLNQIETAARAGWNLAANCHLKAEAAACIANGIDVFTCMQPGSDFTTHRAAFEHGQFMAFFSGGAATETLTLLSAASAPAGADPELPPAWIAPIAAAWESLLSRIADPEISDDVLMETAQATADRLPELIDAMDVESLTDLFESAMGQAVVVTAQDRQRKHSRLLRVLSAPTVSGIAFAPMADAVARMGRKTPIASRLTSAQWAEVPLALRDRAFFSAKVESVRFLANAQDKLQKRLSLERERLSNGKEAFVNRDSFIRDMRGIAKEEGIQTTGPDGRGSVRDIRSVKRLGLIYDMQTESAAEYARWKMDNDPDVLDEFPAYRLGPSSATQPRPESYWRGRWNEAGSSVGWRGASRVEMIALKTSPIWSSLSVFGTPWPPFDYGSTRMLEDVDRAAASALGLIKGNDKVPDFGKAGSTPEAFNDRLEASVTDWPEDQISTLKLAFGEQVKVQAGKLAWQGNLIGDLADEISTWGKDNDWKTGFDNKKFKGRTIRLGAATSVAVQKAAPFGHDLVGSELIMTPDNLYHHMEQHGSERERVKGQRGLTTLDLQITPHIWRSPDKVEPSGKKGEAAKRSLIMSKRILGDNHIVVFDKTKQNQYYPVSHLSKIVPAE